jgi:hypothetical protein
LGSMVTVTAPAGSRSTGGATVKTRWSEPASPHRSVDAVCFHYATYWHFWLAYPPEVTRYMYMYMYDHAVSVVRDLELTFLPNFGPIGLMPGRRPSWKTNY